MRAGSLCASIRTFWPCQPCQILHPKLQLSLVLQRWGSEVCLALQQDPLYDSRLAELDASADQLKSLATVATIKWYYTSFSAWLRFSTSSRAAAREPRRVFSGEVGIPSNSAGCSLMAVTDSVSPGVVAVTGDIGMFESEEGIVTATSLAMLLTDFNEDSSPI